MLSVALVATLIACGTENATTIQPRPDTAASTTRVAALQALASWNAMALKTTAAGPFSPPRETRALAMVSAAVYDAVTSITQDWAPYASRVVAPKTASIEGAIAGATHRVLVALYPAQAAALDRVRDSSLALLPANEAVVAGVAVGRSVAAAILAQREGDHSAEQVSYTAGAGMGKWTPTPPGFAGALEPGWGHVSPFFLTSPSQLRPTAPPVLGGAAYTRDYVEISSLGSSGSTTRSALQSETARFWITTAAQLWNQVAREATIAHSATAAEAARAYLLLNLAGADAMIAAWEAKYFYGQWRPVTAIRSLADDGNATTVTDTAWTSLITTPPFPDYPAGHTTYGGAAERVLTELFGDAPGELTITSPSAGGATHRYANFREISDEVVNARVWGGVHWRTSCTVGRELGRSVGQQALARAPGRQSGG